MSKRYSAIVVGGGIFGLSTAYHLLHKGIGPLAVIEQFSLGHNRGSSHGGTRIARGMYLNPLYTSLYQVAVEEDWPHLQNVTEQTLFFPTTFCRFGSPSRLMSQQAKVVRGMAGITTISVEEARHRFPELIFPDKAIVIVDDTSGVIAAQRTLSALQLECEGAGADLFENTEVLSLKIKPSSVTVETTRGTLSANYLVMATGAWSSRLLPQLSTCLSPIPQTIGYYQRLGQMSDYSPATFPVWLEHEEKDGKENVRYGTPPIEGDFMKIVQETQTSNYDPAVIAMPDAAVIEGMNHFVYSTLRSSGWELAKVESCLYNSTPSRDFLIDFHPESNRIIIVTGGSGHGFKFAPLIGRAAANLLLDKQSGIPEFEAMRHLFTLV